MIKAAASALFIGGTSSIDIVNREVNLISLNFCFLKRLYFGTLFCLPIRVEVKRIVLSIGMKHLT